MLKYDPIPDPGFAAVRDCNLQRFVTLDGTLQRENRGHEDRWPTSGVGIVLSACFIANSVKRHHNIHIIKGFLLVDSSARIAGPAQRIFLISFSKSYPLLLLGRGKCVFE